MIHIYLSKSDSIGIASLRAYMRYLLNSNDDYIGTEYTVTVVERGESHVSHDWEVPTDAGQRIMAKIHRTSLEQSQRGLGN